MREVVYVENWLILFRVRHVLSKVSTNDFKQGCK